jgi:tetratricopeptide (TPR) repeat protein
MSLNALGRFEESLENCDVAIELAPTNYVEFSTLYMTKASALSALDRHKESLIWFDKAIDADPKNAWAYYLKGSTLLEMDREDEAQTYYDKARELGLDF